MMFWLLVAIVVSLSIGFVMGATFRQKPYSGTVYGHRPPIPFPPPEGCVWRGGEPPPYRSIPE